ncbi:MAG: acyl transferase [Flavobacteriaceae bacterium]|nr:acyl transferase [Flavobacteriaceae bacterium]
MFRNRIFKIGSSEEFEQLALEIFQHQAKNNIVYKQFLDILKFDTASVKKTIDIPFLPIYFFKRFEIITGKNKPQEIFLSSGTTGIIQSKHFVTDVAVYKESYITAFEHFYGSIKDYTILALLPSYLERKGSSLIYMVHDLIKKTKKTASGFYLNDLDNLAKKLNDLNSNGTKVLLIGVTYALLDLIEKHPFNLQNTIVMETGGMKGKRREMIREELHEKLCKGFGVPEIHSEYGMTELLSQSYSKGNGIFETPSWMKILIRDTEDAFSYLPHQKSGGINIIDLANYNSCSFIATQDLGKLYPNNSFEVLGRFDQSDIRGCNLLIN